ncbi:MAG: hypothetical protein K2J08_04265 [Ruminococcus sp.]|nr:hypothetical protein [Ruminococcus sp.]
MESTEYKCPNCSAGLTFMPETQKFGCEYCSSEFEVAYIQQLYADEENATGTVDTAEIQDFEEHTNLYHCASCGADIMADDEQTALFCYYCHNPVILSGKLTGEYKPDKIIGFKLTREQAENRFKEWVKKRWFVPKDFKTDEQLEKMTGLYVPFWTADCDMKADVEAIGKKIRTWTSGDYKYTNTKEYAIARKADIITEGIPADGESKIEDLLMESIEPFDYDDLKDFSMSYFSGFFADKFDMGKADVFPRIKQRATQAGKKVIDSSIFGYDSVIYSHENYRILGTKWQHIMLPVWFMTYRYKDKVYEFAVNGQTGKLAGTPPLDSAKLALFSSAIGLAVTAVSFLIGGFLI